MDNLILWGVVLALILILLVVAILVRRKYPRPTDYYALFTSGIVWMIIGIPLAFFGQGNYLFFFMGILLMIIGLIHKDKWKKNRTRWKDLKKPEKIIQWILIAVIAFIIAVGIAYFLMKLRGL